MSTDGRRTLRNAAAFRTGHRRTFGLGGLTAAALALGPVLGSAVSAVAATPSKTTSGRAALAPGKVNHILVIDLENEGYQTTFGANSPATYLNGTLRKKGELLQNYYGVGHASLDNYIAQVSGQAPTAETQADCSGGGIAFANMLPGTPDANGAGNPGQVDGSGCVYPSGVQTIASQLDTKI